MGCQLMVGWGIEAKSKLSPLAMYSGYRQVSPYSYRCLTIYKDD